MTETWHLDMYAPEFVDDCWELYAGLRESDPVARSDIYGGFWVLSRYEDVKRVALDDSTFSSAHYVTVPAKPPGTRPSLPIETDPPRATEFRRALSPWFSPAVARRMEPVIQDFADRLFDRFIERGECDLVPELTNPLPAMTTLAFLGLEPDDWEVYTGPVHAQTFLHPRSKGPEFHEHYDELRRRVRREIELRRAARRGDMISSLLDIEIGGVPLTDEDVHDVVMLILHGGMDTTGSAIGNAAVYLSAHRDARSRLQADLSLLPVACEEFLRFQAPQPGLARVATRDTQIARRSIARGDRILLLWASANRDECAFDDADEVVLDRTPNKHLTFGIGAHRCLGAPLARTEMTIALRSLLLRTPDFHVLPDQIRRPETAGVVFGHTSIPMTFTPGRTRATR